MKENSLVLDLENEPVVIHNLPKFKELVSLNADYYRLAEDIVKDAQKEDDTMKFVKKL